MKVLSPLQAKRELAVLSALAPHPSARAVRVLSTVRVGMDTGIITPYCPGKLFVGCTVEAVLEQATQLCEVGLVEHIGTTARRLVCVDGGGRCRALCAGCRWLALQWSAPLGHEAG